MKDEWALVAAPVRAIYGRFWQESRLASRRSARW